MFTQRSLELEHVHEGQARTRPCAPRWASPVMPAVANAFITLSPQLAAAVHQPAATPLPLHCDKQEACGRGGAMRRPRRRSFGTVSWFDSGTSGHRVLIPTRAETARNSELHQKNDVPAAALTTDGPEEERITATGSQRADLSFTASPPLIAGSAAQS